MQRHPCWPSQTRSATSEAHCHPCKPFLLVDLSGESDDSAVAEWLKAGKVAVLNVAGPRESGAPGVHGKAAAFLREVLGSVQQPDHSYTAP